MAHVHPFPSAPGAPLFRSRLDAGEDLYFQHPAGRPEPTDLLIVVASDGAVEVAYPWAYLCTLPVLRVDPGTSDPSVPLATGRAVAFIDDGLLAIDALTHILTALRRSGPTSLAVVAPALRSPAVAACRAAGVLRIATLLPASRADAARRFYRQHPVNPAVASGLMAEVRGDRPWRGPALPHAG